MVRRVAWILALTAACHRTPKPVSIAPLPADAYAHYLAGKLALYRDDAEAASHELAAAAAAAPEQPMLAVELGPWPAGTRLSARVAQFVTVVDGRISRLETYDCYDPVEG